MKWSKRSPNSSEPNEVSTEEHIDDVVAPVKTKTTYQVSLLKRRFSFSFGQAVIFILVFGLLGGYALYKSFAATPDTTTASVSAQSQLLLRFKPNATKAQRDALLKNNNLDITSEIPQIGVKVVTVPANAAAAVKTALSHNPAIDFVEVDQTLKPQEQLPNDPYYPGGSAALLGGNWPATQTRTSQAWDITEGNSAVTIAILDTGIKPAGLADYSGQISSTWNVMTNSTDATSNAGNHGTYVAGASAAAINNGEGNNGICAKCHLMIVQVGTDSGASTSDIAAGMTYAADHGAKVINMSWAGFSNSSTLSNATTYAHNKGLVLFAAAGNSNCDCTTYPAASPNVLGVGGTSNLTGGLSKSGDSNFGSWVAIAAPEGYVTGWPTLNGTPGYGPVGGTSLASPVAAGVAGLLFSYNPSLTNTQVEQAIESTAIPATFTTKYGRIDTLAALQAVGATDTQLATVPVQTAEPHLYYEIGDSSHLAPLTTVPQVGQVLVRGIGGWSGTTPLAVTGMLWQRCDTTGAACTNLTGSGTYTVQTADVGSKIKLVFSVKNNLGTSSPVALLTGTIGGSPTVDTTVPNVSLSTPANGATISGATTLSAVASDNVGVAKVEYYADSALIATSSVSPYNASWNSVTLANGQHTLQAKAYDAAGNVGTSAPITVTTSNSIAPSVPTGLAPTPLAGAVTLTWNANTEADLAGYDLQYKPSTASAWTTVSNLTGVTYTVSGLTNGTSYDFQLRARNTTGQTSAWTATVTGIPLSSTPADTTAPTVTITSPADGTSITKVNKLNIRATATDNNVVIKLELYIDNQLKTTVTITNLSYNWNINRKLSSGSHTILIKAYDASGNIGQSQIGVVR